MKIKKAVLTGGGRATRLRPVTSTINKHLIPLANKPMIFHAIEKVMEAGVEEIFINTNPGETELQKYIGDGGHWGIKIKFFEQEGGPQGVAHVVKQAEKFIGNDPFMFYLSDNVILGSLKGMLQEFEEKKYDSMLALAEVPNARHFGVPYFDKDGKLIDVVEKPADPPNNFAVTGIYIYGSGIFFKAFDNITKSARGEYEISSIHSYLLKNNFKVGYKEITGWWKDTGQPDDLIIANRLLMNEIPDTNFKMEGKVENGAEISGKVYIGIGTTVGVGTKIMGPVIIGQNCTLEGCTIGPNVSVGVGCEIKNAMIKDSIVLGNCRIDCDMNITNSIMGEKVSIIKNKKQNFNRLIVGDQTLIEL